MAVTGSGGAPREEGLECSGVQMPATVELRVPEYHTNIKGNGFIINVREAKGPTQGRKKG